MDSSLLAPDFPINYFRS